jgi:hypothetical protein
MNFRAIFVGGAAALALALGGCGGGGGDDHADSTAVGTGTTPADTSTAQAGQQQAAEGSTTTASKGTFTLGSPSDVPRSKGGDNSVQDYGSEASEADRAAAGRALQAYYDALAKGDTEGACALFTSRTREGIEQTLKRLPIQGSNAPTSCSQVLKLTANVGSRHSPQLRLSELLSLRQQDEQAFLIYKAGDGTVYSMPMGQDGSDWKVGGVTAAPLVP